MRASALAHAPIVGVRSHERARGCLAARGDPRRPLGARATARSPRFAPEPKRRRPPPRQATHTCRGRAGSACATCGHRRPPQAVSVAAAEAKIVPVGFFLGVAEVDAVAARCVQRAWRAASLSGARGEQLRLALTRADRPWEISRQGTKRAARRERSCPNKRRKPDEPVCLHQRVANGCQRAERAAHVRADRRAVAAADRGRRAGYIESNTQLQTSVAPTTTSTGIPRSAAEIAGSSGSATTTCEMKKRSLKRNASLEEVEGHMPRSAT